jgi:probable rRNA maturation factor
LGCQKGELSILLLDDEGIRELNRTHLKRNRPTDVISFPQDEVVRRPGGSRLLGDVAISLETAQRQAGQSGKPLKEECAFLLIHGILHLLGYDHEGSARKASQMVNREKNLFLLCKKSNLV